MSLTPTERILAAVEQSPDRRCVTLRRDDARAILAQNQRLAADVDRLTTGCVRLEAMNAERCTAISRLSRERDGLRQLAEQRRVAAMSLIHPLSHLPHAWARYVACTFAGVLIGCG